jgi:hypothetical protein
MQDNVAFLLFAAALGFGAMAGVQALFRRFVIGRHMRRRGPA